MKHSPLMLCAISLIAASPTFAQAPSDGPSLSTILSGAVYPLVLRMRDLDSHWSAISRPPSSDKDDLNVLVHAGRISSYTKGDIVSIGGEPFLVTYQPELPTKSTSTTSTSDFVLHLGSDSLLDIALVNIHTLQKLQGIKPFNLTAETGELSPSAPPAKPATPTPVGARPTPAPPAAPINDVANDALSDSNLKALGYAVVQYCQMNKATLPPLAPVTDFHDALKTHIKSDVQFLDPEINLPYMVNVKASGKPLSFYAKPSQIPILWEPIAHVDDSRGVLFADGHSKRMTEAEWQKVSKGHVSSAP